MATVIVLEMSSSNHSYIAFLFRHPLPYYIRACFVYQAELVLIYSYFEKGCRKKCTRQSRKVLWMVFSSLFFKEI